MVRTYAYVDGFNLYYRLLRNRPRYKCVNLKHLIASLLDPSHDVVRINYYTARVGPRPSDPHAPSRQVNYLKALATIPEINVHQGKFRLDQPLLALAKPPTCKPADYDWTQPYPDTVKVMRTQEKGSDVNLASHLVRDAYTDAFDVAVVITSDSDLIEPIKIAVSAGKRVGLLAPSRTPSTDLKAAASFYRHIREGHLKSAQFASSLDLGDGTHATRPENWV